MNRFILCLLFSMILFTASSQKVYFVYLQEETDQPFYVRMNEKVYSSAASGYLILSKLRDSSYSFSVGFPQDKWPEQYFSVVVNKKDHGYLLKNFGEKGWGLFDLQGLSVQMSSSGRPDAAVNTETKDVSAFTDILSKAADDPSLKEKPVQPKTEEKKPEVIPQEVVKKEEVKNVVTEPVIKKEETKPVTTDPPVVKNEEPKMVTTDPLLVKKEDSKIEIKEEPVVKKEEAKVVPVETYTPSVVTKGAESSTTEGFGLIFIDNYDNGIRDTIRIIIPNPKPVVDVVKEEPKEEKKFIDIIMDTSTAATEKIPEVKKDDTVTVTKPAVKNNCKEVATESDFLKLRKRMAAETDDDDMVDEARKYFKTKCFTTAQLKNLGALFLDDLGKYKFFDLAYLYVSDAENFANLQSELKNEYYINRFRAMLRN